jgi:hypothetical protein
MRLLARLGTLVTLVALSSNFGCSKENEEATTAQVTQTESASNVAGMSKETLLVLKFHHDS